MTINNQILNAEAYDDQVNVFDLALKFRESKKDNHFYLAQNSPNPFKNQTLISFLLPKKMVATIRIFDVTGKLQKTISRHFPAGENKVFLKASDFNEGILYYQLEAGEFQATKKMVLLN